MEEDARGSRANDCERIHITGNWRVMLRQRREWDPAPEGFRPLPGAVRELGKAEGGRLQETVW